MSKVTSLPTQNVILDTNIISYAANKASLIEFSTYVSELALRGFGLAISDISIYELLRGAAKQKEGELIRLLALFTRYDLSSNVMVASAQLDSIMKMEQITVEGIDHGDKFIAATAILTNSLIMTANYRDFPLPFFQEVERRLLTYMEKGRPKSICVLLLQPDLELVKLRFNTRK